MVFQFGGVAAASENIVMRRVSSLKWDSWRRWVRWPFIAVIRFPAAAIMASAVVAVGFERYLCLWNTVADTRVVCVYHPNLPFSVVFERGAKDISISTVCGKFFLQVWFAVH